MSIENIKVAGKLSTGTLGLDRSALSAAVKGQKKAVPVAVIYCQAASFSEKPSTLDASKTDTKFIGQFEGKNLRTDEVVRSGSLYLPGVASDYLRGVVQGANGELTLTAITLTAEVDEDKRSATGYKFGMQALADKDASADPFASLRIAIEAPKKSK